MTADEAAAAAAAPVEAAAAVGEARTTRVVDMQYCGVCKCPYEFCEWGPLLPECKEKITASWDELFPVERRGEAARDHDAVGPRGQGRLEREEAQSAKKPADGGGGEQAAARRQGEGEGEAQVVIELNTRNKKKHITVVRRLEHFGVDTAPPPRCSARSLRAARR